MPNNKYVIDTNVFIQSKNREYRFEFCEGFWDWIKTGHADSCLFSCKKVYEELRNGDVKKICPARAWADGLPQAFFLEDLADPNVMKHYATLMNWVVGEEKTSLRQGARSLNQPMLIRSWLRWPSIMG